MANLVAPTQWRREERLSEVARWVISSHWLAGWPGQVTYSQSFRHLICKWDNGLFMGLRQSGISLWNEWEKGRNSFLGTTVHAYRQVTSEAEIHQRRSSTLLSDNQEGRYIRVPACSDPLTSEIESVWADGHGGNTHKDVPRKKLGAASLLVRKETSPEKGVGGWRGALKKTFHTEHLLCTRNRIL